MSGNSSSNAIDFQTYETVNMAEKKRDSKNYGIISLILAITVIVLSPLLALIPVVGFALPITALCGTVMAHKGLDKETGRTVAVIGLILSALVFMVTLAVTTWWNFSVAIPALADFEGINELINELKGSAPL